MELYYNNTLLNDNSKLQDYNIKDGDQLVFQVSVWSPPSIWVRRKDELEWQSLWWFMSKFFRTKDSSVKAISSRSARSILSLPLAVYVLEPVKNESRTKSVLINRMLMCTTMISFWSEQRYCRSSNPPRTDTSSSCPILYGFHILLSDLLD